MDDGTGSRDGDVTEQAVSGWLALARELAAVAMMDQAADLYQRYFVASRRFPALYGARLTVALGEWAALAAAHPPARETLVATRQRATGELLEGTPPEGVTPGDLFAEIAAVSAALGEPQAPAEIFAELDARAPAMAAGCAIAAHRHLVRAGQHALARRYLTDPEGKVSRLADVFQIRLGRLTAEPSDVVREARRQSLVRDYAAEVRDVLALLTAPDDADLADRTLHRAVQSIAWEHVRAEVVQALERP